MSLVGALNRGKVALISPDTYNNILSLRKRKFYANVLKYMNHYSLYNYLQITNPFFGLKFSATETIILEAPILTSLDLLLYFSRYKDATFVDEQKLEQIRKDINENRF
jgi:hypothetical protein